MVRSRIFIFLAVTLCSVACWCAQATVSEAEAIQAINNAKQSTVNMLKAAKYELKEAQNVKRDMDWHEEKAEKRVSEAEAAAKAAVEAAAALVAASNNNQDKAVQAARQKKNAAQTVATNQKQQLKNALASYPNVKNNTNTAIQSLNDALLEAQKLDEEAEIEVLLDTNIPIDYTKVRENALSIKRQTEALEKAIKNATKLLSDANTIIYRMPAPTREEFIEKYKTEGLASGAVLDNVVGEAKNIVNEIEFCQSQVNQSVETIKKIFNKNPQILSPLINGFLTTAQGDLVTISQTVNEVHKAQENIMKYQKHAENSKAMLNGAKNETSAKNGLRFITFYAESCELELQKIKKAQKSAEKSVRSAYNQLQRASDVYFENEDTLNAEVNAVTENPEKVMEETNVRPSNQAEEQKTNQNKESPVEETTLNPTNKAAVQPTNQKTHEPSEEKTITPARKEEKRTIANKPAQFTEEESKTEQTDKDAAGHTENVPDKSTGHATKPTSKNTNMPTDNKPEQLPEEQITKPTSNASEGQSKNKPEQSAEGDTEPPQKDATMKSTMLKSENVLTDTSQNSAHQASSPQEMEKTVQPKDQKSEILDLDKLRKGKKDITKLPFFGENVPASGAWSDSSMILCVPLLAALIVSAVLH